MDKEPSFWHHILFNRRWLSLGIGIKRWLLLLCIGALIIGMGFVYIILLIDHEGWMPTAVYNLLTLQFLPIAGRILVTLLIGTLLLAYAIIQIGTNLVEPFGHLDEQFADTLYEYRRKGRGPHIVAIGGGTGMPNLVRGLTAHTRNITTIVTVGDDGGSSGRLRRQLGLLPPGDFRNNLAALSRDEALMTQLLQYRFGAGIEQDGELKGHAFGNLLLAALTGITGSFDEALLGAEKVLSLRGRVLPSTLELVTLYADIEQNGTIKQVVGESAIPKAHGRIQQVGLLPEQVKAYPPTIQAILKADLIVMGPGSLYTSILPNLLVPEIAKALQYSRAPKVYVCNLATQPGETDGYSVADHVETLLHHLPYPFIDYVLANDNLTIPPETGGGQTIYVQPIPSPHIPMTTADLVDETHPWRHDSQKLAQAIVSFQQNN